MTTKATLVEMARVYFEADGETFDNAKGWMRMPKEELREAIRSLI